MTRKKQTEKEVFLGFLKTKGLSLTKQRLLVLRAVYGNHDHFEAEDIADELKKHDSRVSRATVYRTLSFLEACELIRKVDLGHGHSHYEHVLGHVHHEHLCCIRCGSVTEVADAALEKSIATIARTNHFNLTSHKVQMFGLCAGCSSGKANEHE